MNKVLLMLAAIATLVWALIEVGNVHTVYRDLCLCRARTVLGPAL